MLGKNVRELQTFVTKKNKNPLSQEQQKKRNLYKTKQFKVFKLFYISVFSYYFKFKD